jgi:hypothetical protein
MSQRPFLPPTSFPSPVSFNLSQLATSADGHVYFDVASTTDWHAFNGMQIQVVPEPSSLALCGGGLVLLGMFRRRLSR